MQDSPPPLSPEAKAWVRREYQSLYWQVMEDPCVTFNSVIKAWDLGNPKFDEPVKEEDAGKPLIEATGWKHSPPSDKLTEPDNDLEIRSQVSQFLEYHALKKFSECSGGLRKMVKRTRPLVGCALTGNDQIHAVMNSRDPELTRYADEVLELSRDTHRVFQEAGYVPAALRNGIGWAQWLKKGRNRRISSARRNRRDAAEMLYSILTRIVSAAPDIENKKTAEGEKRKELKVIRQQWKATRARVNGRIQRHARFEYAQGVFLGTLITVIVLAALGWLAWRFGGSELNVPGDTGALTAATIGGTGGAFISVTQRLTRSTLLLDFTASRRQKIFLGTLRPAVGAVFGAFVYFAIIGGLFAIQSGAIHKNSAVTLAFFAVAGFVSGFSERFAAGVLENAGSAVMPAPWGMQDDRPR